MARLGWQFSVSSLFVFVTVISVFFASVAALGITSTIASLLLVLGLLLGLIGYTLDHIWLTVTGVLAFAFGFYLVFFSPLASSISNWLGVGV
jgi:hypothetical protein